MARRLDQPACRAAGKLAGGPAMICPTCHGNGYLLGEACSESESESDDGRGRDVKQCATCASSGEMGERENDD